MKRHRFGVLKDWCVLNNSRQRNRVPATPRSLLNAETEAPGCFGLFGWHVPSSVLL